MNDKRHNAQNNDDGQERPSAPRAGDPSSEFREVTNLVKQYFNTCNAALSHGMDNTLSAPARELLTQLVTDETITLEVSETGEDTAPIYTTRFIDGQFTPIRGGPHGTETRFTLTQNFLKDVERNVDDYIRNPQKLDWSWLRGSIG
jgi:hypothetical protein